MKAMSREEILEKFPITLVRVSVFAHEDQCSIKATPFQVREEGRKFFTTDNKSFKASALMVIDSKMRDDVMSNFTYCHPEQVEEAIAKVEAFVGKRIDAQFERIDEQLKRLKEIKKNFTANRNVKIRENKNLGNPDDE